MIISNIYRYNISQVSWLTAACLSIDRNNIKSYKRSRQVKSIENIWFLFNKTNNRHTTKVASLLRHSIYVIGVASFLLACSPRYLSEIWLMECSYVIKRERTHVKAFEPEITLSIFNICSSLLLWGCVERFRGPVLHERSHWYTTMFGS